MLGFAPLAAAPLGAVGSGGVAYDIAFSDAAVVVDAAFQASPIYLATFTGTATGADATRVTASTFTANMSGAATGDVTTSATAAFLSNMSGAAAGVDSTASIAAFNPNVSDGATGTDSALVQASNFSATVFDTAAGNDTPDAAATFSGAFSGAATIDDANAANYLWKTINDSQTSAWGSVNAYQPTSWGTIDNNQPAVWTPVKTQA